MTRPAPAPIPVDLIAGLGGAAVLAAALFATAGDLAAVLVGGLAAGGLVLRWRPAPPLVLLLTAHFSLFPEGVPVREPTGRSVLAGVRVLDLLTAAAALVYAGGCYRYLRRSTGDAGEPPADDLPWLFGGAVAAALFGQAALALVGRYAPDYRRGPLRFRRVYESSLVDTAAEAAFDRFVMLAGLLGGGALVAGLVFWVARLNRLSAAEASQLLLDVRWQEARRELARIETWRAGGLARGPARPRPPLRVRLRRLAVVCGLTVLVGGPLVVCGAIGVVAVIPRSWRWW